MTLAELIRMLKSADPKTKIDVGFGAATDGASGSGVLFKVARNTTIGEMLKCAEAAIGVTFEYELPISLESEVSIFCHGRITVSKVLDWLESKPKFEFVKLVENPDLTRLRAAIQEYADFVQSDDYFGENDHKHYIYEAAIDTFLGDRFWEVLNSK